MQAIILAGGRGTRFQEVSKAIPKILIPIGGKPLLDHIISNLLKNDINDVIICTGHLGEKVREYVKTKDFGLKIYISQEKKPLGTAGALNLIKNELENNFFLLFGDVYFNVDLKKMYEFHKSNKSAVTAVVHKSTHPKDSNLVELDNNLKITRIVLKPHNLRGKDHYNFAAMYLLNKKIKDYLVKKAPYDFERDLLIKLLDENLPMYGYNTPELITDIGTPDRLTRIRKLLQ